MVDVERVLPLILPLLDREFVPPAFDAVIAADVLSAAGMNEPSHTRLLQEWNGFYAFDGLLHVFGACSEPANHSLQAWNAADGWRLAWGRSTEGLTFFAEDAFGDQFAYRAGKIVRLRPLLGGIVVMQATLLEWIETLLLEPDRILHRKLFRECTDKLGPLPRGAHFVPSVPLETGTPLNPEQSHAVPARDSMEMKAVSAAQVVRRTSQQLRVTKA